MAIPDLDFGFGPLQTKNILAAVGVDVTNVPSLASLSTLTLSAASDFILKPSGDTDDYFTFATVSNIPTIYGTGSYVRIGDAGATAHSLNSEDDLMVSGKLEVKGASYFDSAARWANNTKIYLGVNDDVNLQFYTADANANMLTLGLPDHNLQGNSACVLCIGSSPANFDYGLFDGLYQPLVVLIDKDKQLHSATDGIADAGGATPILKHVGGFTAAVIGDIVRITAGTNCTAGWYWITTVTSADQVTLDRNYTSANTTNVTFVTFHNFPMIGADGVCLKCFGGAPGDANTEIDRDGWLELDLSRANGRLYWRANNAWHYVDATA